MFIQCSPPLSDPIPLITPILSQMFNYYCFIIIYLYYYYLLQLFFIYIHTQIYKTACWVHHAIITRDLEYMSISCIKIDHPHNRTYIKHIN